MRLRFDPDGTVEVRTGKVELGQGIVTALAQIAAHELGLPPDRVRVRAADTRHGPDEGFTSGSLSVQDAGAALRRACAEACASGRWQRPAQARPLLGESLPRLDLPAKFAGRPSFIHDLEPTGLLHGRVLHPPRHDALLQDAGLEAALDAVRAMAGVAAVRRDGQLLGVLAQRSRDAERALARLRGLVRWEGGRPWQDDLAPIDASSQPEREPERVAEHGGRPSALPARRLTARYAKPWIAHASIGPACALACWPATPQAQQEHAAQLRVWTHSQGIFALRRDLALAFGLEADAVRVQHVEGAGCYGHNGADDVAFDAAWLARHAGGRTVRVVWSRVDEMSRAPFGPAMVVELEAELDALGDVRFWQHRLWSPGHSTRPGRSATPALLGSWQTGNAFAPPAAINMPIAVGGGATRNAVPPYALPAWQVWHHVVDGALPRPSALRSLGAFANVFAAESFVDEIALARGESPLAWRRRHLAHDARALAVLELAAAEAGWGMAPAAEGVGLGLAFARYKGNGALCAVVAEVEAGAELRVRRLTLAVDVGLIVNPAGVRAQIEGGAVQATSWTLKEALSFDADGVTSDGWESYPILRFSEVPAVAVHLVPSGEPSLGAGEAALGPTAAAIANALHAALGVRVRKLPLSRAHILEALHQAPA